MNEKALLTDYGISPAYFISAFTDRFTADQILSRLPDIKRAGYTYWQPEVYHEDLLDDFLRNASQLAEKSASEGLKTRVFAAHFLLHGFRNASSLTVSWDEETLRTLTEALKGFQGLRIVSVPLPLYEGALPLSLATATGTQLIRKIDTLCQLLEEEEFSLALEVLPDSLLSSPGLLDEFLSMDRMKGVGFLFDSGHFHAAGFGLAGLVEKLGKRIVATHLSDNDGETNLSLPVCQGNIDWSALLPALDRWTDLPCLTLEIVVSPEEVRQSYETGLRNLTILQQELTIRQR